MAVLWTSHQLGCPMPLSVFYRATCHFGPSCRSHRLLPRTSGLSQRPKARTTGHHPPHHLLQQRPDNSVAPNNIAIFAFILIMSHARSIAMHLELIRGYAKILQRLLKRRASDNLGEGSPPPAHDPGDVPSPTHCGAAQISKSPLWCANASFSNSLGLHLWLS